MSNKLDYSVFGRDSVAFPLSAPGSGTALRDCDPALFFALDFLSAQIRTYMGPRLLSAAGEAGAPITDAVAQRYPWAPAPEMLQTQFRFPLLAVYRTRSLHNKKTAGWYEDEGHIGLLYALPPLNAGQLEQVGPLLYALSVIVTHQTVQGWDPQYTPPGGTLADQPWSAAYAGVDEIGWTQSTFGGLPSSGNLWFPTLLMEGVIKSRDTYVSIGNKFAGADITASLIDPDGTSVQAVQVATHGPPTIAAASPATGRMTGGTIVTLTGTGFLAGATVYVGGTKVLTRVTVSSPTSLTFATPAATNPGTQPITVWNPDGQSASLPNAFAYAVRHVTVAFVNATNTPYVALPGDDLIEIDNSDGGGRLVYFEPIPTAGVGRHTVTWTAWAAGSPPPIVHGNGKQIQPYGQVVQTSGALAASTVITDQGNAATWEFDGSAWVLVG